LLVEDELVSGRLVQLLRREQDTDRSYRLIFPPHKTDMPALQAFAAWLRDEPAGYRHRPASGLG
jgi:DNA-binding transcriptional LysR family regulator